MERINTEMDFEDDVPYQKRAYIIQTIGIFLIAGLIIASIGGVFGYTPWTKQKAGENNFFIEYEPILRSKHETPIKIHIVGSDSVLILEMNSQYFEKVELKKIIPEPEKIILASGKHVFQFRTNSSGEQTVTFLTLPKKTGSVQFTLGNGQVSYSINQFIYH